jgi:citrate lyase subunit beta/citryl-CoA lyase
VKGGSAEARSVVEGALTFLFVPGTREDRYEKAIGSGAGMVIIDLEDAVAPDEKVGARTRAAAWLAAGGRAAVRVNGVGTPWFLDDLMAVAAAAAIVVPKVEGSADVHRALSLSGGEVPILPLIETARGVLAAHQIAAAPGVARVGFGNVDFAAELGVDPTSQLALASARSQLVYASSAAGIAPPVDGVTAAIRDHDALVGSTRHARELGFTAKLLVHPSQVEPVEQVLRPTAEELSWAKAVLQSIEVGVGVHEGEMVDEPVLLRARRLLRRQRHDL